MSKRTEYFSSQEELNQYYSNGVPSTVLAIVKNGDNGVLMYTSSNNDEAITGTSSEFGGYPEDYSYATTLSTYTLVGGDSNIPTEVLGMDAEFFQRCLENNSLYLQVVGGTTIQGTVNENTVVFGSYGEGYSYDDDLSNSYLSAYPKDNIRIYGDYDGERHFFDNWHINNGEKTEDIELAEGSYFIGTNISVEIDGDSGESILVLGEYVQAGEEWVDLYDDESTLFEDFGDYYSSIAEIIMNEYTEVEGWPENAGLYLVDTEGVAHKLDVTSDNTAEIVFDTLQSFEGWKPMLVGYNNYGGWNIMNSVKETNTSGFGGYFDDNEQPNAYGIQIEIGFDGDTGDYILYQYPIEEDNEE